MKHVLLRAGTHSLYKALLDFPPDGYHIYRERLTNTEKEVRQVFGLSRQLVYDLNKTFQSYPYDRFCREARTLFSMNPMKKTPSTLCEVKPDLVYVSQQLLLAKVPWVVDFEYANALVNYGDIRLCGNFTHKTLASDFCKKMMPWSEWSRRTLLHSVNCDAFKEKVEVVHFGIPPKNLAKKCNADRVRFLFVGSTNQLNYLNFEWKGGLQAIEAIQELSKKYDVELVVRSWVPPEIKARYGDNHNIKIIDIALNQEDLHQLYASSDIFLFPSHLNLGMAILEAMSYELPVIAINLFDVSEAVQNMKTGILINPPPDVKYYMWNGAPNHQDRTLLPTIRYRSPWITKKVVEKASLLVEDGSLRRQLGRQARLLTLDGEFSITRRNEKLKRIFDEATTLT